MTLHALIMQYVFYDNNYIFFLHYYWWYLLTGCISLQLLFHSVAVSMP